MLQIIDHSDSIELFKLVDNNKNYLREWLPWIDDTKSVNDTAEFIKSSLIEFAANKSRVYVVLYEGSICGVCSFNSLRWDCRAGFIGYWLAKSYQGKGIMSNAVIELEGIGLGKMNLNKIEIHIAVKNYKSRSLAERLGYQETGIIKDAEWLYNHFVDHVIYCKLKSEWDIRM